MGKKSVKALKEGLKIKKETIDINLFGPQSGKSKLKWTKEEDELLLQLGEKYKGKKWNSVAKELPGKTFLQCSSRWNRIKPGINQGRWTKDEKIRIREYIKILGTDWSLIAAKLGNRTGKQVRDHYKNVMDPNISKEKLTVEDDKKIFKFYQEHGSNWKLLKETIYPCKTADSLKNRFYSYIRKNPHLLDKNQENSKKVTKKVQSYKRSVKTENSNCQVKEINYNSVNLSICQEEFLRNLQNL
jgi:hypothetical protein